MLGQLHDSVVQHWRNIFSDLGITGIPDERFLLSPVDDERAHYELCERQTSGKRAQLPFVALARGDIDLLPTDRSMYTASTFASEIMVPLETGSGLGVESTGIVRAAPIKMMYVMNYYTGDLDAIDLFVEKWLLAVKRGFTYYEYYPTELELLPSDNEIGVTVIFNGIETVLASTIDRDQNGAGFSLRMPITIESILTTAVTYGKVILDTETGLVVEPINLADNFPV